MSLHTPVDPQQGGSVLTRAHHGARKKPPRYCQEELKMKVVASLWSFAPGQIKPGRVFTTKADSVNKVG